MIRRFGNLLRRAFFLGCLGFWPPYFGAGIRVKRMSQDFREIVVEMGLHFWNQNYVGTHFGGSLYAMVDPFYMLMLIENLGPGYIVWDKAALIRFKKPGRTRVQAVFRLEESRLQDIIERLKTEPKLDALFHVQVTDTGGNVIAEVEKTVYVRKAP
jgi:hypothetical protein